MERINKLSPKMSSTQNSSNKIKIDFHIILKYAIIPVNLLFLVILLLNYLNMLPAFWNHPIYFFIFALVVDTAFLALKIKQMPEHEKEHSSIVYLSKYFFLLGLIVIVINQFLKRQIIIDYMPYITGLVIALGFLTFYSSRDRVEKELEDEKNQEENAENRRKNEFEYKYPRINKIWGLRSLVKWMYKEGWAFSIPFVIIAIIFIAIKIGMPIVYTGSYLDEYFHIFSGIEFFKSGHFAEIYREEHYNRGAYVSFLVGLFFKLFGQTIFVAKMVPAFLGIINFFLLYLIARNFIEKKKYTLLLLMIYTISPWVIFNHFYIRMYVFYEFFILLVIWLYLKLVNHIKNNKNWKAFYIVLLIILLDSFAYYTSHDTGINILFVPNIIFFMYIIFSDIFKNNKNTLLNKIGKLSNTKKLIFLIVIATIIFFLFNIKNIMPNLIQIQLEYSSPDNLKYDHLFFVLNPILTILFILSFYLLFCKLKNSNKLVIISIFLLFIIHYFSPLSWQVTHGILYFFPLFYLISINALTKIKSDKLFKIAIIILILFTTFNNYPQNFIKYPYISGEVNYIDNSIYKDVKDLCVNATIITSGRPGIAIFYGVTPDYLLTDNYYGPIAINIGFDKNNGEYFDTYTKTPAITNLYSLIKIFNNDTKVCYIRGGLPSSRVTPESILFIKKNFNKYNEEYIYNQDGDKMELYIKND